MPEETIEGKVLKISCSVDRIHHPNRDTFLTIEYIPPGLDPKYTSSYKQAILTIDRLAWDHYYESLIEQNRNYRGRFRATVGPHLNNLAPVINLELLDLDKPKDETSRT